MLRKGFFGFVFLAPMAIILVYPFILNDSGLGMGAAASYHKIQPLAQAMMLVGHYLQAAVLILSVFLSFKIGRSGRVVRLLAFFTAISAAALTCRLRELPVNQIMVTGFPTVFVAFLALSRARAALEPVPDQAAYRSLKQMRNMTQLIFLANVLIGGIFLNLTYLAKTETLSEELVYVYLIAIFVPGPLLAVLAGAGWRNRLFNQLCALSAVFLMFFHLWAVGGTIRVVTPTYFSDFPLASLSVSLIVLYGFCWLVLACALIFLVIGLNKRPSLEGFPGKPKSFRPFRRLALMTPPAALLLAVFLYFGLYGPAGRWPEIKPLPPEFELIGPYRMGPLSLMFSDNNFDSSHLLNWVTGIVDDQRPPFSFKEKLFSSTEKADEEYADAIRYAATYLPGYRGADTALDDQTDLSAFEVYSPALTVLHYRPFSSPDALNSFKQAKPDRLMLAFHLRLAQGCLTIYSEPPHEPARGTSPPRFVDEQVTAFLERVKILLEAYHWLGFNDLSASGYATRYGWIDPAKIPGTGLSSSAGLLFGGEEGAAKNGNCYFSLYLNDPSAGQYIRENMAPVDILANNLYSVLAHKFLNVADDSLRLRPRTLSGLAGLESFRLVKYYETPISHTTLEWVSQKRRLASSDPWLILNLTTSGRPDNPSLDQGLALSLWEEILQRVKIETTE